MLPFSSPLLISLSLPDEGLRQAEPPYVSFGRSHADLSLFLGPLIPVLSGLTRVALKRYNTTCSPFFPDLRADLGPYLVDKMEPIENIDTNNRLRCHVDLVLRPRRCGKSTCSSIYVGLYPLSVLKLFDQALFLHLSK